MMQMLNQTSDGALLLVPRLTKIAARMVITSNRSGFYLRTLIKIKEQKTPPVRDDEQSGIWNFRLCRNPRVKLKSKNFFER